MIATLICILGKELQTKWKSLRDQFMKARKLEKNIRSGASAGKKKKYIYYDHLQFLVNYTESRETISNLSPTEEMIQNVQETSYASRPPTPPTPTPVAPTPHASTSTPRVEKRKFKKDADDGMQAITEILRQSVELQRQEKDADQKGNKAFLSSILPFLDKMTDDALMEARLKIMQVIQTAMRNSNRGGTEIIEATTPASTSTQSDISSIYSLFEL